MFENLKIYNPNNIMVVLQWVVVSDDNSLVKKNDITKLEFKKPEPIIFTKPRKVISTGYGLKDLMNDNVYKCDTGTFYKNYDTISEEICLLERFMSKSKNMNIEELYKCKSLFNEYFIKEVKNDKIKYKQTIRI